MHWHPSMFRPGIGHGFPGTHVQSLVGTGVDVGRPKSDRTHLHSGQGMEMAFRNPCLFLLRNGHGCGPHKPPQSDRTHVHSYQGTEMAFGKPCPFLGRNGHGQAQNRHGQGRPQPTPPMCYSSEGIAHSSCSQSAKTAIIRRILSDDSCFGTLAT